jgi:glycosyltransferase involved in cell wall biosynthesis
MLGVSAQRVHTVYEGVDARYRPQSQEQIAHVVDRFSLRQPFIYYIGGLDVRKNIPLLLRAFGRVRRRYGQPVQLVIGGKQSGTYSALFPALDPIILDEGLAGDVAFIGPVTTEENAALYAGAAAFVWPSRYEGFGLPPLEAMASGAAVISSDTSSMPEIVGDGGLLIPPHDTESWAVAMLKMLSDPELRQTYRQRGRQRAAAFDWTDFARQMVTVYERIPPRLALSGSSF